jgi:beta-galactosidase/beta-glucuronidase
MEFLIRLLRNTRRLMLKPAVFFLLTVSTSAWSPAGNHLMSRFASDLDPANPLPDYPRPQLVRGHWSNLNGIWACSITDINAPEPDHFPAQILVPFPIESSLSGLGQSLGPEHLLWYRRNFNIGVLKPGERLLLNFGAVNWEATVFVNGRLAGSHRGGYDPFSFDISSLLKSGSEQTLVVKVYAPASGPIPRGKQSLSPSQIFYTASSGIWQTVWTEVVPQSHLTKLQIVPDIHQECAYLSVRGTGGDEQPIFAEVLDPQGQMVSRQPGLAREAIRISLPQPKLWSPKHPDLYVLRLQYGEDRVESYFGMRSIAIRKDQSGINRIYLNDAVCFMFGLLDQGFWPDGLYTAPSDRALRYDLEMTKAWGFNTIRKHMKVEPARWYYWADKLGILVWQDFPAPTDVLLPKYSADVKRPPDVAGEIEGEMRAMVDNLTIHSSVIGWIPFNEGWGQFDTARVTNLFKAWDPTRLVDDASGWIDRGVGDIFDRHSYPEPLEPMLDTSRASFQGEYGGGGLLLKGHDWNTANSYQYAHFESPQELLDFFTGEAKLIREFKKDGLAGAIYTQTTDVENEINGLMSYDRIPKIDSPDLKTEVMKTISDP